ncbi:WD40-repeat-containing domain protein [Flammula alnicola]|nr:WD40-repeat-containing domain protein [Flammula alnicola]
MSFYPHSRVVVGPTRAVDIVGPHIQTLDSATGDVLHSTANFPEKQQDAVLKSGPVRCAAVDSKFMYLVTSGEDKMLKLWELDGLKLLSVRELPKKPTAVAFTADAQTILVSDKFGDIFRQVVHSRLSISHKDAISSHENPSGGQLILGHASPLNAFLLTPDEKYIITADRDEHVRVSRYPDGYNIEMYCLGHLKFVSAIHIPKSDHFSLISGGGDPMLKIWDWMTGTVTHELPVLANIEPFIAVRASKRKRGGEDDDDEAIPEGTSKLKPKRKKGRKEKEVEQAGDGGSEGAGTPAADAPENKEEEKPEKVLVIHQIESIDSDTGPHIIFSAIGTTALFAFPYKKDVSATDIRHFDFGKPVLDFSVVDGSTLVVNLDGAWLAQTESVSLSTEEQSGSKAGPMAKILKVSGGELVEDSETLKPLIDSLNSRSLLPATPESLKKLALYSDLVSLPKYADPFEGDDAKAKGKGKTELSKKELGRMKTKQAVLAKAMEIQSISGKEKSRKLDEGDVNGDEPEPKRARSDFEAADNGTGRDDDVNMDNASST